MDKFGIFNLLNSLLSSNNAVKEDGNATEIKTSQTQPPKSVADNTASVRATLPPLQNSMLSVMKSHDEIFRRVMASGSDQNKTK